MKFLLTALNSKYIHTNPALYSLRSYALYHRPDYAEHIDLCEYTINNRMDEILGQIYRQKPDVLGFSLYIWNVTQILELVREIHKIMPGVPIWLGGPEASYRAKELVESYPELTGVIVGEGEQTFLELLTYYLDRDQKDCIADGIRQDDTLQNCARQNDVCQDDMSQTDTRQDNTVQADIRQGYARWDNTQQNDADDSIYTIHGLCLRKDHKVIFTPERELTDLSELPFLYQDLKQFEHKIIYYETSRGCPFRCSYCLSSIDKKVRLRDIGLVKKELQYFLDEKVPQVKFIDRTFNCNHEHAWEIWSYIKEHDNGITNFHFEIGADLLTDRELELLNSLRPGAVQMEIGVQTTNEKTLQEIRRVMDIGKLKKIVERLHSGHNIHIHLDLIAGLPYEDYESFRHSFDDVYRMKPEQLQLGFLKVLSGSYMKEAEKQYDLLYTSYPPYEVLSTKWISYEEICRLKQVEEMVEIYYNSNQFTYTIPYLERFFDNPFDLYETLALFYEKNGYFVNTPSRMYRYDVLLQFAEEFANREIVVELLTMDVYLRENAKSRPSFAKDLSAYKERVNCFYRMEEKHREDGSNRLKNYEDCDARMMVRQLHIEPFSYDIFGEEPTYRKLDKEVFALYDYRQRNPLTYDAEIVFLTEDEI